MQRDVNQAKKDLQVGYDRLKKEYERLRGGGYVDVNEMRVGLEDISLAIDELEP